MRLPGALLWLWLCSTNSAAVPAQDQGLDERNYIAGQLWEQGQAAMRQGKPDDAIRFYDQSLATDPRMVCNHLSLATAYLEKKNTSSACEHLGRYVEARPEQLVVRSRYAELLVQVNKPSEARAELERLVIDVQDHSNAAAQHLIRTHGRLMELAESEHDEYTAHLHRGIGLFLLARKRIALGDPDGELPPEGLLCKAAAELTRARHERPGEARPCWYLYEVWTELGQRLPAIPQLKDANAASFSTYLTPAEQRGLHLAYQRYLSETQHH